MHTNISTTNQQRKYTGKRVRSIVAMIEHAVEGLPLADQWRTLQEVYGELRGWRDENSEECSDVEAGSEPWL